MLTNSINALASALASATGLTPGAFKYLGSDIPHRQPSVVGTIVPRNTGFVKTIRQTELAVNVAIYGETYDGVYANVDAFLDSVYTALGHRNMDGCITDENGNGFKVNFSGQTNVGAIEAFAEQASVSEARHFKVLVSIPLRLQAI